jgi:hypothetical protein
MGYNAEPAGKWPTCPPAEAPPKIHGIVDLRTSDMTVRAVTRVHAGMHGIMQSEYRRLLNHVLDQQANPRPALAA